MFWIYFDVVSLYANTLYANKIHQIVAEFNLKVLKLHVNMGKTVNSELKSFASGCVWMKIVFTNCSHCGFCVKAMGS